MVDSGIQASIHKNLKTTLPRITNYITSYRFRESNLVGKLYPEKQDVSKISYWLMPEEEGGNGAWENYTFDQIMAQDFTETSVGVSLVLQTWSTVWFKVEFSVPTSWEGGEVRFRWRSGTEAGVWTDQGVLVQGLSSGTLETPRPEFVISKSFDTAQTDFVYYIEMVCGKQSGASDGAEINPPPAERECTLSVAELVLMDTTIYKLVRDLEVIYELADQLIAKEDPRGYIAMYTGNQMVNDIIKGDNESASNTADTYFAKTNGTRVHNIAAIANCHIDSAWLWPYSETKRKVGRSFSSQLGLIEDYPEMKFVASQAQQWAWCKEYYNELYQRILEQKENFLPVGSVWVEMDGNIPSGESFIRQFLFGQKFYKEEYGSECKEFWLPDTFGYSAQIPGMMAHVGLSRFLTKKLSWNLVNKFPHHNFTWEGIDGTAVLAHFPPGDSYHMTMSVDEIMMTIDNLEDKGRVSTSSFLFGHGDGGGGPTQNMLERARRLANVDGCPKVVMTTPDELFTALEKEQHNMCRWVGELYLELHNGTYTTHAAIKEKCRQCEFAFRDCEYLLSSAVATLGPSSTTTLLTDSMAALETAWKNVLLNQFHDVLPGSSIEIVYPEALQYFQDALVTAEDVWTEALVQLFGNGSPKTAVAFNTLQWPRQEIIETTLSYTGDDTQTSEDGGTYLLQEVAPFGFAALTTVAPDTNVTIEINSDTGHYTLSNGLISAEIDTYGKVTSLRVLSDQKGRDLFVKGEEQKYGNQIILFDDEPLYWDAWDVNDYYLETGTVLNEESNSSNVTNIELVSTGPLVAKLRWQLKISDVSDLTQDIELRANTDYLIFSTTVNWHEDHKLLKMSLDTNLLTRSATFDIQFGQLERPNHMNTSWDTARYEVCGHKWADLSEPDWGVSVLNQSKYGWYARFGTLGLSLLRSPKSPDYNCDMGVHTFKYAIMPHTGTLRDAELVRKGYEFNNPLIQNEMSTSSVGTSWAPLSIDGSGVVLHTVKPAQDLSGDVILRFFECDGCRSQVTVNAGFNVASVKECNGLEVEGEEIPFTTTDGVVSFDLAFTNFQIRAVRLILTS